MNNKKKPVETSTVLITIAFLAIFIIMRFINKDMIHAKLLKGHYIVFP